MIYDCVIVGAGPAGSTAAYHLANRGFSVLLLDKEKLPRYKPCGGLVIDRVSEWVDFDFSPAISVKISRIRISNERPGGLNGEFELPRPVWMVHREVFDYYLVQQAQRRGAVLSDQFPVTAVVAGNEGWRVVSGKRWVEGRYLIAADGAKGMLSSWLGFNGRIRQLAGALEAEIPDARTPEAIMHLKLTNRLVGYAWNFAKADSHSIGVGLWKKCSVVLRKELEDYCESFGQTTAKGSVCGHPLLLWNGEQRLHTHRALLAGEAACMVDPFNGEGIRPALISGALAADAIVRELGGASRALEDYSDRLQKEVGEEMGFAKLVAMRRYSAEANPRSPAAAHPLAGELFARLACGDITYKKYLMGHALLRMLRPVAPV